jgi:hypothetical protein
MAFGDLAWATASRGRLTGLERLAQVAQAVRLQLSLRFGARPAALGAASPDEVERLLKEVVLPPTEWVRKAAEWTAALGPAALANHALRTWAFGCVLGLRNGLRFDREVLALASLLHDIGLARRSPEATCFAADGASQAMTLLREWGAPLRVSTAVADAICLHVRVAVPLALGAEAHLVHAGAGLDVIGASRHSVPSEIREDILHQYPRADFKGYFREVIAREAAQHPESRIRLWVKLGFLERIASAPFES